MLIFLFFLKICPSSLREANNFIFESNAGVLTITGYGYMENYTSSPFSSYIFTNVIFKGNVLSIGDYAFNSCSELTNIKIPSSVITIGESAFGNCYKLTSITVESGNNNYVSIDDVLFNYNKNELIAYPVGKSNTSYSVPTNVVTICNYAFYDCSKLSSITIPTSVTTIGDSAFYWCYGLTNVTINGNPNFGIESFSQCSSLKNFYYYGTNVPSEDIFGHDVYFQYVNVTNLYKADLFGSKSVSKTLIPLSLPTPAPTHTPKLTPNYTPTHTPNLTPNYTPIPTPNLTPRNKLRREIKYIYF